MDRNSVGEPTPSTRVVDREPPGVSREGHTRGRLQISRVRSRVDLRGAIPGWKTMDFYRNFGGGTFFDRPDLGEGAPLVGGRSFYGRFEFLFVANNTSPRPAPSREPLDRHVGGVGAEVGIGLALEVLPSLRKSVATPELDEGPSPPLSLPVGPSTPGRSRGRGTIGVVMDIGMYWYRLCPYTLLRQ